MQTHFLTALCLLGALLGGCATYIPEYQERLTSVLPDQRDVKFTDSRSYPGEILCGTYESFNGGSFTNVIRQYVVGPQLVLANPDAQQIAVYCSEDPAEALYAQLGIGAKDGDWSAQARVLEDMRAISAAIADYYSSQQSIPVSLQDLLGEGESVGPSLTDPWGASYQYVRGLSGRVAPRYELFTLGADGEAGGSGVDADIRREALPLLAHVLELREN